MANSWRFFFVLLPLIALATAQRCEPFAGQPTLCAQYLTSSDLIYIGPEVPGSTQADLVAIAQPQATLVSAVLAISPSCYAAISRFLCISYFQVCTNVTVNGATAVLPRPPCRADCLSTNQICGPIFTQFGQNQTDCLATTASVGLPTFPDKEQIYNVNGTSVNVTCNSPPASTKVTCGGPLIAVRDPIRNTSTCALKCPSIPYTDHQWKILRIMMIVLGWIGLVALFIVGLPFLFIKQRRQSGSHLTTCILGALLCLSLACLIPTFVGYRHVCKNDHTFGEQSHFASGIGGFLMSLGGLASVTWCTILILNAVLTLHIGPEKVARMRLHYFYHLYCWGEPAVSLIVGLAAKRFGGRPGLSFPFVVDNFLPKHKHDGRWWMFSVLMLPAGVNLVITYTLIIFLVLGFASRLPKFSFLGLYQIMKSQIRMLAFVLIFCNVATSVVVLGYIIFARTADYTASALELVVCWSSGATGCPATPKISVSFGFNAWVVSQLALSPTYGFLLFGTIPEVWYWWKCVFMLVVTQDKMYWEGIFDRNAHPSIFTSATSARHTSSADTSAAISVEQSMD